MEPTEQKWEPKHIQRLKNAAPLIEKEGEEQVDRPCIKCGNEEASRKKRLAQYEESVANGMQQSIP
jgi:hypothetical protein